MTETAALGPVLGAMHSVVANNGARLRALTGLDKVSSHMSGTKAVMHAVRLARYTIRDQSGTHILLDFSRSGRAMRLVQDTGATVQRTANPPLVKLLLKARRWWAMLRKGQLDIKQLAAREGVQASYVTRVVGLAFLSPVVIDAILKGSVRSGIDAAALTLGNGIPACWQAQARAMLPQMRVAGTV